MSQTWIVDAFASRPFTGNPAAVYVLEKFYDDEKLQLIAAQMNLSETAFVVPKEKNRFDLRWFTPEIEVKLCGHATLAATHVLLQSGQIAEGETAIFDTLSGELSAMSKDKKITLDFPALPTTPIKPPAALNALGVEIVACERNDSIFLIELKDFATLKKCAPNFSKLAKLDALGVAITTNKNVPPGFDFASRFFAPKAGIDEDPVTGSAHCALAPYWMKKLGKDNFRAFQASKSTGELSVNVKGARVLLSGKAFTTLRGDMSASATKRPQKSAEEVQEMVGKIRGMLCN